MIDLTPETAGASSTAIRIAQRILELDGMAPVRDNPPAGYDLRAYCADVARQVDVELNRVGDVDRATALIEAAPDLLEACEQLALHRPAFTDDSHSPYWTLNADDRNAILAAIAKAEPA